MLSELSKIGLSTEAIYCFDCDNHREYLQRKANAKDTKCDGKNGDNATRRANEAQRDRSTQEKPKKIHE